MAEFPKEFYFSIEHNSDLEVSIVIGFEEFKGTYWVECNLTTTENRKIFRVLGKKFYISDEEMALSEGMRIYRTFLESD